MKHSDARTNYKQQTLVRHNIHNTLMTRYVGLTTFLRDLPAITVLMHSYRSDMADVLKTQANYNINKHCNFPKIYYTKFILIFFYKIDQIEHNDIELNVKQLRCTSNN